MKRLLKSFRRQKKVDVETRLVPDLSYKEYIVAVLAARKAYPSWRQGQTYFNVLHTYRPDLADWIQSTPYDPFYDDQRLDTFLQFIHDNWESEVMP